MLNNRKTPLLAHVSRLQQSSPYPPPPTPRRRGLGSAVQEIFLLRAGNFPARHSQGTCCLLPVCLHQPPVDPIPSPKTRGGRRAPLLHLKRPPHYKGGLRCKKGRCSWGVMMGRIQKNFVPLHPDSNEKLPAKTNLTSSWVVRIIYKTTKRQITKHKTPKR